MMLLIIEKEREKEYIICRWINVKYEKNERIQDGEQFEILIQYENENKYLHEVDLKYCKEYNVKKIEIYYHNMKLRQITKGYFTKE